MVLGVLPPAPVSSKDKKRKKGDIVHNLLLVLHIIGAGVMIGMITVALVISFSKTEIVGRWKLFGFFGKLGMIAAIWQLATGVGLYLLEPEQFKNNPLFWVKIGLFMLDGIIATQIVDRRVMLITAKNEEKTPARVLSGAFLANFLILTLIITIGVFIAD